MSTDGFLDELFSTSLNSHDIQDKDTSTGCARCLYLTSPTPTGTPTTSTDHAGNSAAANFLHKRVVACRIEQPAESVIRLALVLVYIAGWPVLYLYPAWL